MSEQTIRPAGFRLSVPVACVVLTAAMAPAGALAGWHAYARHSTLGLQAALLAAGTCWLSATAALVLTGLLAGTPQAISGILGGTLVRLAGPLLVTVGSAVSRSPLASAGLFGYLVVFFFYVLIIETSLLLGLVRSSPPVVPQNGARLSPLAPRENVLSRSESRQKSVLSRSESRQAPAGEGC
ncbi:MAG TPA: hypothetical protein VJ783_25300 [Pirellulales bacterium]|nr:hypothetical protein [Pirellulales bacterium]